MIRPTLPSMRPTVVRSVPAAAMVVAVLIGLLAGMVVRPVGVQADDEPAGASWDVVNYRGRSYVTLRSLAGFYGFDRVELDSREYLLGRSGIELRGRKGAKELRINGLRFHLSYPVLPYGKRTLISVFDVTHLVDPVLRPPAAEMPRELETVVIDAAHGGDEPGVRSPAHGDEKAVTLEIARHLEGVVERRGFKAILTRRGDDTLSAGARAGIANRVPGETVFVSLHLNRSGDADRSGIETFSLAPAGTPATYDPEGTKPNLNYYLGNLFETENTALATAVHGTLVARTRASDDGIKRARFPELQAIGSPGIVVRLGFLSHREEAARLASPQYQALLAGAIAEGIERYAAWLRQGAGRRAGDALRLSAIDVSAPDPMDEGIEEERRLTARIVAVDGADIDPGKVDIEIYFFDLVDGEIIEPATAEPPEIFWASVLPDWREHSTEELVVRYLRRAFSEAERQELGTHRYLGYVLRILYDGRLQVSHASPARLERSLYQFYAVRGE